MKRQKSLIMPKGFRASGVASGIKDGNKLDLGLIISDYNTTCAAAFTTNLNLFIQHTAFIPIESLCIIIFSLLKQYF